MPTLQPYPAYRQTDLPWLGQIPAHWEVKRLKWTTEYCQNGAWGDEPNGIDDVACVRVADFDRIKFRVNFPVPTMRALPKVERRNKSLKKGDLLLEKSGGGELQPVGFVVLYDSDEPAICSNFVARMPVRENYDPNFLCYLHATLYSGKINTQSIKQNTGIQNLDSFAYLNECVPLPPLPEQRTIAAYLDRQTAKIDALIARKHQLLDLLAEQRAALISQAVTKGLNPAVEMKDSGVAWLGQVPSHWEVKRMKYISTEPLQYGANESAEIDDPSLPRFIRITDIREDGTLKNETFKSLPEEVAEPFLLKYGDILFARSGATVGKSFMYRKHWGKSCYAGYLIRVRVNPKFVKPEFISYFANSSLYWNWISSIFIKATIQNVSAEKYGNMLLPIPSLLEQEKIIDYLDYQTKRLTDLAAKIETAIARLQEYRAALISSVVTGKVRVQGLP